jgi:hypothetical protein
MKLTKKSWVTVLILISFLVMPGCQTLNKWLGKKGGELSDQSKPKKKDKPPIYYDFGDVLIPSELKVDKEASFVYRTPSFSAGVMTLQGRVEVNSLIAFFVNNMAKDNWREVAAFKSPRSMLLYQKDNRWCVINISDRDYYTYVEIWVAPTIGDVDAGLLK